MPFEKGNNFWKLRSKHGRDRIITDSNILWESACEYFEATDNRKWTKTDWVGKDALEVERKSETPYTKSGLCLYLDIEDWRTIESLKSVSNDFMQVVSRIEKVIYTQKLEGATVGAFNSNIVARELGLVERTDVTTKDKEINRKLTPEEIKQMSKDLDNDY